MSKLEVFIVWSMFALMLFAVVPVIQTLSHTQEAVKSVIQELHILGGQNELEQ